MGVHNYTELKAHVGHKFSCVSYGDDDNVAVECETCNCVLFDYDREDENDLNTSQKYANWMYEMGQNENGNVTAIVGDQQIEITEKDARGISHLFEMEKIKSGSKVRM